MVGSSRARDEQRAASETAILDAAWDLFARLGPDGASLRDVGDEAGCTHALVVRYYGTKLDLEGAVAGALAQRVDRTVTESLRDADDPLVHLLGTARARRSCTQLLIRTALGDLPPRGVPGCLHLDRLFDPGSDVGSLGRSGPARDRRRRVCAYAAASLVLGFVTFEDFLVAATRLGSLAPSRRDAAIAGAARALLSLVDRLDPRLTPRDLAPADPLAAAPDQPASASQALLQAAIQQFAERGPASVSVRDVARHAGVNQGLIYRHFGSKEALLTEALEVGSSGLFPAALAPEGFDFDAMSWLVHNASPAPRLIGRTLVDGVDISAVRRRYPILRRLLAAYDRVPTGAGRGDLSDPRLAVTATAGLALGSAVWGPLLRHAFGLGDRDGVESAIADLARLLVMAPAATTVEEGDRP